MSVLNTKRGVIKGKLTRFAAFLDAEAQKEAPNITQIKTRLSKVESLYSEFEDIQSQIEVQITAGTQEVEDQEKERENFENHYFEVIGKAQALINDHDVPDIQSHAGSTTGSTPGGVPSHLPQIKLPRIVLPQFDGSYEKWTIFYKSFEALVHNHPGLTSIEKLHYLRSSLTSKALEVIDSDETNEAEYDTALALLKERYDNKKWITETRVKALLNISPVNRENASQLQRFLDDVRKHIKALKSLGQPTESWDLLLVHILSPKLDPSTQREWEIKSSKYKEHATFQEFCDFLQQRYQVLEAIQRNTNQPATTHTQKLAQKPSFSHKKPHTQTAAATTLIATKTHKTCPICGKASHRLFACEKFMSLGAQGRWKEVETHKLCQNCLNTGHTHDNCQSGLCRKCSKKHNTLLHTDTHQSVEPAKSLSPETHSQTTEHKHTKQVSLNTSVLCSPIEASTRSLTRVILATAVVDVVHMNKRYPRRVLVDPGSEINFVTQDTCDLLGIQPQDFFVPIGGIGEVSTTVSKVVDLTIQSQHTRFRRTLQFFVLPNITKNLPMVAIDVSALDIPSSIELADPNFHTPSQIDMLLSAEIAHDLMLNGQLKKPNNPVLQRSQLGWLIGGALPAQKTKQESTVLTHHASVSNEELSTQLRSFWELEEVDSVPRLTKEEQQCEEHFTRTHTRDEDGRFVVRLPFKSSPEQLGESRTIARKRFELLEKRFTKDPDLKKNYTQFMQEYQDLSHMQHVADDDGAGYYLPHHAVVKVDSLTTKLRVVFDASCATTSGSSLNDTLLKGPTLQDDIFTILVRWRCHTFVLTADIQKMYRQIRVHNEDIQYQKILWRENPQDDLKTYALTTVTYGTKSAPYLATRSLKQLAKDHIEQYPLASRVLLSDFYVDDAITGTSTLEEAIMLHKELTELLRQGCFELRKWRSNSPQIFLQESQTNDNYVVPREKLESSKALGLIWNSITDCFRFSAASTTQEFTKRAVLSTIAQIYDPLGLVGPVIVVAKLLLQRLWQLECGWDDTLPHTEHQIWCTFQEKLPLLNHIEIQRHITCPDAIEIQLHGFADASQSAYGACLYLRTTTQDGVHTSLIASKSRVAPLKTTTLPRLELCAALLLSQLVVKVKEALILPVSQCHLWTDSSVVLHWISSPPSTWKIFVSNRVAQIQDNTSADHWHHVPTETNPADVISRGLQPDQLLEHQLWWKGPSWLKEDPISWPSTFPSLNSTQEVDLEVKMCTSHVITNTGQDNGIDIFERYSSYTKLILVVAYCRRFAHNAKPGSRSRTGNLTAQELEEALLVLVRQVQHQCFLDDIKNLQHKGQVTSKSKLLTLNPFIDENSLVRVGGRLKHAELSFGQKHPLVLPAKHHFTELVIRYTHLSLLHAGCQAVLAAVRHKFWPLCGRREVRKVLRRCITCFRRNPSTVNPLMGELPAQRVNPSRPFQSVGIDYAGPITIRESNRRGRVHTTQCYIAVFVCLACKAVHLELVNGLTTEAFLAALKRFMARRGKPAHIFSDNATNFVKANKELRNNLNAHTDWDTVSSFATSQAISWHFIPARSPTFGGLWEAAVKSIKYHLVRITGNASLTYEEYLTLLVQVEGCLNSRPLIPTSEDPNDLTILTPSHFLIGHSLLLPPDPNFTERPVHLLDRWKHIQQLYQHLWRRWSKEYLSQLQQRSKWCQQPSSDKIRPGSLVLLKDDNLAPLHWRFGRITQVFPGTDNIVRVVEVKTASGLLKRAVNKVCLLPLDMEQ